MRNNFVEFLTLDISGFRRALRRYDKQIVTRLGVEALRAKGLTIEQEWMKEDEDEDEEQNEDGDEEENEGESEEGDEEEEG